MSPVMKIPGSEAGSGVGLGSKSGSVSQRYGSTDPDQDRTKISRIRNTDFYVPVPKTVCAMCNVHTLRKPIFGDQK
jgi:hypothetical protein